jgi:hypothetical protein
MGQSKFQRSSLTTNNNRYYIDTTPSKNAQLHPPGLNPGISHLNVFEKDKTYYVFLLFAKATTKQTYDMYVGKGFDKSNVAHLFQTRVELPGDYIFKDEGKLPAGWATDYNQTSGVLSVTMDMSKVSKFATEYAAAMKSQCQPTTFCKWNGSAPSGEDKCQCADSVFSPPSSTFVANECTKTNGICSWAIKDVDCPEGGCYGFGVKMSGQFVTSDSPPNPAPTTQCFPKTDMTKMPPFISPWDISFTGITDTSDKCFYSSLPAAQFCP